MAPRCEMGRGELAWGRNMALTEEGWGADRVGGDMDVGEEETWVEGV